MTNEAKSDILLESGTNELGVLEFSIAGNSFGINVAKVKKLNQYASVQFMPRSNPFIEGVYKPRDEIYTVVDLAKYIGLPPSENPERDIFIVTGFNKTDIVFHVHNVENIHRISWSAIEKPDTTIYGGTEGIVTGIAKVNGRIISIIDFEKIIFDISPMSGIQMSEIDNMGERPRSEKPILIAEDSMLLRRMIEESLHKAGYSNIIVTNNGKEAWDKLVDFKKTANLTDICSCVITDIEMPQMDGHFLTKSIKNDPVLKVLPVIIFSSLINEAMMIKGEEVGADAQLTKPEIGNLVATVDRLAL